MWAADVTEAAGAVGRRGGHLAFQTEYGIPAEADGEPPVTANWLCETGQEWMGTHIEFPAGGARRGHTGVIHAARLAGGDGLFALLRYDNGQADVPAEGGGRAGRCSGRPT